MSRREDNPRRVLVLDATAFYAGTPFTGTSTSYVPPSVLKESQPKERVGFIEVLIDAERLVVKEPSNQSLAKVKQVAASSGDLGQTSLADLSVLALAIDLTEVGFEVLVVTDDYAVQNLARIMGISYRNVMGRGIDRVIWWLYYCSGCGRIFENKVDVCDACGGRVKRKPRSSTPS